MERAMRHLTAGGTLVLLQLAFGPTASRADDPVVAKPIVVEAKDGGRTSYWLESSLKRVFPATAPGSATLELLAARNGRASFQACARNDRVQPLDIECTVTGGDELKPRVRWVEMVPVRHRTPHTDLAELDGAEHIPGLVPDPLIPWTKAVVGPFESRSFWITLNIPADAKPGLRKLTVRLAPKDERQAVELPVTLDVSPLVDPAAPRLPRHPLVARRGDLGLLQDRHVRRRALVEADPTTSSQNMLDHGSDVVYVPVFFDRRETFKRPVPAARSSNEPQPGQIRVRLVAGEAVHRHVQGRSGSRSSSGRTSGSTGASRTRCGSTRRRATSTSCSGRRTPARLSDTYLNFLEQFLPEFHEFLHRGEAPGRLLLPPLRRARRRPARRELQARPARSSATSPLDEGDGRPQRHRYGKQGLTDMPIPMVSSAQAYIDAKIPHWVYYCCVPAGPVAQPLHGHAAAEDPHVRLALLPPRGRRASSTGASTTGTRWSSEEPRRPVPRRLHAAMAGHPLRRPVRDLPGPGRPDRLDPLGGLRRVAPGLRHPADGGHQARRPALDAAKSYADFPKDEAWLRRALGTVLKSPRHAAGR